MDTIAVITQKGVNEAPSKTRNSARAVVVDTSGRIPMMHVKNLGFHKLPGGGIDAGETAIEAVLREVREETGCEVAIEGEIGRVLEV